MVLKEMASNIPPKMKHVARRASFCTSSPVLAIRQRPNEADQEFESLARQLSVEALQRSASVKAAQHSPSNVQIRLPDSLDRSGPIIIGMDEIEFEEDRKLGEGSTSHVKLGAWRKQPVAIKIAHVEETSHGILHREAAVVSARWDHPNITQFHGAVEYKHGANAEVALVYEYLGGGDISELYFERSRMAGKPWSPEVSVAISWCTQLWRGLDFLHSLDVPVAHRDIKPANLLLTEDLSTLKLADFSLATPVHAVSNEAAGGSFRYMAPEVYQGKCTLPDKADVYSAAVTSYFLFTGKRPFDQIADPETATIAAGAGLRPIMPSLPAIGDILSAAWDANPSRRLPARLVGALLQKAATESEKRGFSTKIMKKAKSYFSLRRRSDIGANLGI